MVEATRTPERERLQANVQAIAPVLAEHAQKSERIRRLATESVEAMRDSDLFRCASPTEVGGLDADPLTQIEVYEAVTAIDGAAGWNLMIGAISAEMIASRVGDDEADEIFGGSQWPILAGLVWPRGKAKPTKGGYQVSGRWSFGSGIHQSDWVYGGTLVIEDGKPKAGPDGNPAPYICVVPRSEVTIHDNWHVAGLRGTGSCDYSIENAFVPTGRFNSPVAGATRRGAAWARLPGPLVSGAGHAGFALGISKGVLSHLETVVAPASRSMTQSTIGGRESFQLELGRKTMAYDASRSLVLDAHRDLWETACSGAIPSPNQVSRMRVSALYATEIAVEIAQFGYKSAGSSALFETSPIQRALRDILAAQQHIFVRETAYVDLAKARIEGAKKDHAAR
ncbi:MAG: acyl-CoA dehydrogenase family protein [Dehalococcoidia bacterium]|nr:acyl-CoA dehydrogenase family protein [Dehalococcoidia bacterium]